MKRLFSRADMGYSLERITIEYRSEPCEPGSPECRREQVELLQQVASNTLLHNCGAAPFSSLHMSHNGVCWVLIVEGTQKKVQVGSSF